MVARSRGYQSGCGPVLLSSLCISPAVVAAQEMNRMCTWLVQTRIDEDWVFFGSAAKRLVEKTVSAGFALFCIVYSPPASSRRRDTHRVSGLNWNHVNLGVGCMHKGGLCSSHGRHCPQPDTHTHTHLRSRHHHTPRHRRHEHYDRGTTTHMQHAHRQANQGAETHTAHPTRPPSLIGWGRHHACTGVHTQAGSSHPPLSSAHWHSRRRYAAVKPHSWQHSDNTK